MIATIDRRGRGLTRIARVVVVFQFLAVLALPIALCCCLEMTADRATPGGGAHAGHGEHAGLVPGGQAGHTGAGETPMAPSCPHHDPSDDASSERGCSRLVQFVLMLSGLIGVSDAPASLLVSLDPVGVPSQPELRVAELFLVVDVPPPRV